MNCTIDVAIKPLNFIHNVDRKHLSTWIYKIWTPTLNCIYNVDNKHLSFYRFNVDPSPLTYEIVTWEFHVFSKRLDWSTSIDSESSFIDVLIVMLSYITVKSVNSSYKIFIKKIINPTLYKRKHSSSSVDLYCMLTKVDKLTHNEI